MQCGINGFLQAFDASHHFAFFPELGGLHGPAWPALLIPFFLGSRSL